ncbi:hypothetical protein N7486_006063 [Penicillium sp. IBT 16267x]|nr:hypothetical protein N7486_006063 [Penicillium sp. IBT 16267x]
MLASQNSKLHDNEEVDSSSKDNVVSRHLVRNTYLRLKDRYEKYLCDIWVEKIEPVKHIHEHLAVASFLIELWRTMYGAVPAFETTKEEQIDPRFPGFIDIACGNGVIVYILSMEGYSGCGYDARRRQTWSIFPASVQERLMEKIYIPKPFADSIGTHNMGVDIHTGDFKPGTFIISNHADELTVWTPLMTALACLASPLPFLAIPCCSHSLSGSSYRFPPPSKMPTDIPGSKPTQMQDDVIEQNPQPALGDLRALRAAKAKEKTADGMLNSMYGSLTAKTMHIAQEIEYDVESTQLQIPSTRNMAIVGGRQLVARQRKEISRDNNSGPASVDPQADKSAELVQKIKEIVERECCKDGGIQHAARTWVERARSLHEGKGLENHALMP